MSTRTEVATTRFLSGYNCAEAVLYAFRDEAGLGEDLALKISIRSHTNGTSEAVGSRR